MLNDYQNKGIKSWTIKDVENYFHDITTSNGEKTLRVITSDALSDSEDLQLQSLIANWYLKKDLKRKDSLIEDLIKTIKLKTECEDFILQVYIPTGENEICFGVRFEAIFRQGILQVGVGSFQECLLTGINNYLTNEDNAKSMIVIKGFNKNKVVPFDENGKEYNLYEREIFHFVVENSILYGVNQEGAAQIQEHDLRTNQYIGREVAVQYIDTNELVAEFEVDKLVYQINYNHLNQ